ncbi:MAG: agmatinase [Bacteroidales bacterium]|nr:agmatinase [Bacteroidales bacterium]
MLMNFGGLPKEHTELSGSKIVILPVPYDATSTWIKGSGNGPEALMEASANMELYDIETDTEIYTLGIHTSDPVDPAGTPEEVVDRIYKHAAEFLRMNKFLVTVGGNHTVSIGAIRAHRDHYGDITVLQLDAHTDLRQEYEGSPFSHASVMARTKEICPVIQVGIRSMDSSELPFADRERIIFAHEIRNGADWIGRVTGMLRGDVYITIDLDVFDPAVVPATGTPEPGGLYYHEVMNLIRAVDSVARIVGFDVVELCPIPGHKTSEFLAAKLIYQTLSQIFSKNRQS